MLKALQYKFMSSRAAEVPLYLQEAARKMQLTIDRIENTANLKLFKTDYLE
ncbi:hypothetical protein [Acinetobacter sp. ASP199]|uniref:hypothetical protein n=1 Tax=unclassified Acinetobacter TaxID=196816 RepID=UPI001F61A522|nr:hypothetical protein [Acinetobacter sp. ASP199]UNT58643.1 hypothetical protein IHE35_11075 [Acinetobacter sp. ASP199]